MNWHGQLRRGRGVREGWSGLWWWWIQCRRWWSGADGSGFGADGGGLGRGSGVREGWSGPWWWWIRCRWWWIQCQLWWPTARALGLGDCIVRGKTTITSELSLFSKFGGVTVPKFRQGATVGDNPEGCQGTEALMASQNSNCSGSRKTHREPPHALRTLGDKGAKLLVDAQRTAKAASNQKQGRLLLERGDSQDITIKCLQNQLAEMAQILVDNKLIKLAQAVEEGPSKDRTKGSNLPPQEAELRPIGISVRPSRPSGIKKAICSISSTTKLRRHQVKLSSWQVAVKQCYLVAISTKAVMKEVKLIEEHHKVLEDIGRDLEAKVVEDLICYKLDEPSFDCFFFTGANLEERERTELVQFLIEYIEVFAWTSDEMLEIDPNFIKHELNVLLEA
ncbi:hypothetical protein Acr_00g0066580 [Actinidia rufa]|uniref:Uncharacterized protein n=1 Tax=Actinidia rufa TaxID=165716 RepID=A0A7J0DQP2_9ERIC|nr:hypothetical protein Acr_00g0066580 [Actinidia rufa]